VNKTSKRVIVLAAALAFVAGTACTADPGQHDLGERQVRDALAAAGYTDIDDVEFDDGMWQAEARREDGRRIDLRLDARTGGIYPEDGTTALSIADIKASLTAAGYGRGHDIRFDDGLWQADAFDSDGVEWELYLDPGNAALVGRERD